MMMRSNMMVVLLSLLRWRRRSAVEAEEQLLVKTVPRRKLFATPSRRRSATPSELRKMQVAKS